MNYEPRESEDFPPVLFRNSAIFSLLLLKDSLQLAFLCKKMAEFLKTGGKPPKIAARHENTYGGCSRNTASRQVFSTHRLYIVSLLLCRSIALISTSSAKADSERSIHSSAYLSYSSNSSELRRAAIGSSRCTFNMRYASMSSTLTSIDCMELYPRFFSPAPVLSMNKTQFRGK